MIPLSKDAVLQGELHDVLVTGCSVDLAGAALGMTVVGASSELIVRGHLKGGLIAAPRSHVTVMGNLELTSHCSIEGHLAVGGHVQLASDALRFLPPSASARVAIGTVFELGYNRGDSRRMQLQADGSLVRLIGPQTIHTNLDVFSFYAYATNSFTPARTR